MEVKVACNRCEHVTLTGIINGGMNPFSRSKKGTTLFCGKPVTSDVLCPRCGDVVVKLSGFRPGCHGKTSMRTVRKAKVKPSKEVGHVDRSGKSGAQAVPLEPPGDGPKHLRSPGEST